MRNHTTKPGSTSFVTSLHCIPNFPYIGVNFGLQYSIARSSSMLNAIHETGVPVGTGHASCTLLSKTAYMSKDNFNTINEIFITELLLQKGNLYTQKYFVKIIKNQQN